MTSGDNKGLTRLLSVLGKQHRVFVVTLLVGCSVLTTGSWIPNAAMQIVGTLVALGSFVMICRRSRR